MIGRGYYWTALVGVCAPGGSLASAQEAEENREALIKAAYLYNFAVHSQWPKNAVAGTKDKFCIGVLGGGALNPFLKKIAATKTVQDKPIELHQFASVADYKPCHLLFIAREPAAGRKESAAERLEAALKKIKDAPVLVVTETEGLAQKGATINFYIEENNVKFEVNLDAVKRADLQISSKVLRLAKVIQSTKK
jgi:YfiR/HmsC-like